MRLPTRLHRESDAAAPAPVGDEVIIACRGLSVAYDHLQVLFDVDIDIHRGQIVALLGSNGAGKTTVLKALAGLVQPISGSIWFEGEDVTSIGASAMAGRGLAQTPAGKDGTFPSLTVGENLRAAAWRFGYEEDRIAAAIDVAFERFPRLAERQGAMAGSLSGGEQQMLTVAMSMVPDPKVLMIDELSMGLAPVIVERLLDMVRAINAAGTTVLLVEQSVTTALKAADHAHFMEKGQIQFSGSAKGLLEQGDVVRSLFLGSPDDAPRPAARRRAPAPSGREVLSVEGVTKRFGGVLAVNDVSFSLHDGEILGIIGPNGAGKTTLFDLISGFEPLTAGQIFLDGEDITALGPDRRAWNGLGRSFQDSRIFPSLTVAENLSIALERHLPVRDHLASMLHLPDSVDLEEDIAWTVSDLIELMSLEHVASRTAGELSTGNRRTVDLAMAVAHGPKVLLLDEPSSGIAQRETDALGELLRRIQRETGAALIVIEHDMGLITSISDRMIALELGAVLTTGTPQEVVTNERVVTSYLGGSLDDHPPSKRRRKAPLAAGRGGGGSA